MLQTHKLPSHTFSLFPILTLNNKHSHTRFNGHYFRRTLVSWFHIVKPFWILWQQETTQKVMLKTRTLKPAKLQSNHHHHHHHHQTHTKVFHRPDALPLSPNQQCQCNEDVQTNPDDSNWPHLRMKGGISQSTLLSYQVVNSNNFGIRNSFWLYFSCLTDNSND